MIWLGYKLKGSLLIFFKQAVDAMDMPTDADLTWIFTLQAVTAAGVCVKSANTAQPEGSALLVNLDISEDQTPTFPIRMCVKVGAMRLLINTYS